MAPIIQNIDKLYLIAYDIHELLWPGESQYGHGNS